MAWSLGPTHVVVLIVAATVQAEIARVKTFIVHVCLYLPPVVRRSTLFQGWVI